MIITPWSDTSLNWFSSLQGLPDSAPPGQGPDLDNDVMSLTDNCSDDVTNTEPRPRGESAVDKFDRFLKDRKESELQLRLDLIGSGESAELDDAIDGGGRPGEDSVGKFDRFLKKREESELGALLELEGKLENGEGGGQEAKHDRVRCGRHAGAKYSLHGKRFSTERRAARRFVDFWPREDWGDLKSLVEVWGG